MDNDITNTIKPLMICPYCKCETSELLSELDYAKGSFLFYQICRCFDCEGIYKSYFQFVKNVKLEEAR